MNAIKYVNHLSLGHVVVLPLYSVSQTDCYGTITVLLPYSNLQQFQEHSWIGCGGR